MRNSSPTDTLKIATWNMGNRPRVADTAWKHLLSLEPDVALVQEAHIPGRVRESRTVADLRMFFADLGLWGWAERPRRQLFFTTDNAKKPELLPRALAPDVDRDLMREVRRLEDPSRGARF